MVEVGMDHWRPRVPISLLKEGHLELLVQMASEDLQGGRLHNSSGQPFQCSVTLTVKFYLMFIRTSQWTPMCPLLLVLLHPPIRYSYTLIHPPEPFLP